MYHLKAMSRILALFFTGLCLLILRPSPAPAASKSLISLVDIVTRGEEEAPLRFVSYIYFEPVMKEVYVIGGEVVTIFTEDFFPLYTLGKDRGVESPQAVVADAQGNVYIAQSGTGGRAKISVFNACLMWERDILFEGFEGADTFYPYHLSMDSKGNLYVAGLYYPGILVMDRAGNLLKVLQAREEDENVQLNDVAVDESGRVYLLSEDWSRVFVLDSEGKQLFSFGEKGGSTGKLSRPRGVAVDSRHGRIYVVDYMRNGVNIYNMEGRFLQEFGGYGARPGWFQYPSDVDVDSAGRILVADTFNGRVQVLTFEEPAEGK